MTRLAILVTGPNATGKTTAVRSALADYVDDSRLSAVYADNSDRKMFKGSQVDIEDRLLVCFNADAPVLVVEGTNRIAMAFARVLRRSDVRQWEAHVTSIAPSFLRWALESRCQKLGKRFRSDYWDEKRLTYETQGRFKTINVRWFYGQMRAWPIGPDYAGSEQLTSYLCDRVSGVLGAPQPQPSALGPALESPQGTLF